MVWVGVFTNPFLIYVAAVVGLMTNHQINEEGISKWDSFFNITLGVLTYFFIPCSSVRLYYQISYTLLLTKASIAA
jgi:hypothetical protein